MFFTLGQAVIRSGFGFVTGSVAMHAQGVYSLADFLTKVLNLVSIKLANRPPNSRFPFGYGKIQFISSIIIGVVLAGGSGLFLFNNLTNLQNLASDTPPSALALLAAALSGVASELMYRFLNCASHENNNSAIRAAALDNRTDAFSSVAVFFGILFSMLGFPLADGLAALGVSLLVLRIGVEIAYDAIRSLLDVSMPQEQLDEVERMANRTPEVLEVMHIRGRNIGDRYELYLQLAMDQDLTLAVSHQVAVGLKRTIRGRFERVAHIHLETTPREKEKSWLVEAFKEAVDDRSEPGASGTHEVAQADGRGAFPREDSQDGTT
ncbi:MAG: cation transporter [Magnetococcales bacterium]|nr:cation transporter [Magnetococcales bacterium]